MKSAKVLSAVAALVAAGSLFAAAPSAPHLTVQAYVNGCLNVGIWWYESNYPDKSGAAISSMNYDVQMKGPGADDYSDVAGAFETFNKNNYIFRCWSMPTNYVGSATLRVRARNATGETSAWVETDPLTATVNVTGTPIFGAGCNASAFDGKISTFIDGTGNSGNDMWTGYLFPEPVRIKGIRYLARIDHLALPGRYQSSLFQIASDASFSDAKVVHQVPSGYSDITRMTEVYFDEPVTCTAIRHWKQTGGYEQSDEIEFIPADPPFRPVVTITPSDMTNFYPVVTWTVPADAACTGCRLERAFQKSGPYTPVTSDLDPASDTLSFTDTASYVGVTAYYRVTGNCGHPLFQGGTVTSLVTPYTRMRRLDRAWGNETALLPGVQVLPGTNGVMRTGLFDHVRCFDGNTSTFVDEHQDAALYPPIGLKFPVATWVAGFGYICRNDNACYYRVRNSRLYAANDYPELADRVAVSDSPTQYSQTTRLYYQPCTTVPTAGATCYFLYGTSDFYGNVAEVMFFGWTEADTLAAPVVTAPKSLLFTRANGGADLQVAWTAGANATSYLVERRLRGTEAWTAIATPSGDTTSIVDAGLATGYYEYRVTSQGDMGTAASEPAVYPFYVPAAGTGLAGTVMWPYNSKSAAPAQLTQEAPRGTEAIDLTLPPSAELAPGVPDFARVAWEGKVVAPFEGSYTFSLETCAGGAVFIDHVAVCNSWTGGTKTPTGSVNLSAGEHDIRVDWRANEYGLEKKCVLRWGGVVADEVVPASQLIPAATPPTAKLDGFTCVTYGSARVAHFEKLSDGRIRITGSQQELGNLQSLNLSALTRPWSGGFDCEMYIQLGNAYGKCGILVQNADGAYLVPGVLTAGAYGQYGWRGYNPETGMPREILPWVRYTDKSEWWSWVRLQRVGNVFTMFWRHTANDPWVEAGSWTDETRLFDRDVVLGPYIYGNGDGNPTQFVVSQFSIKPMVLGTTILFR